MLIRRRSYGKMRSGFHLLVLRDFSHCNLKLFDFDWFWIFFISRTLWFFSVIVLLSFGVYSIKLSMTVKVMSCCVRAFAIFVEINFLVFCGHSGNFLFSSANVYDIARQVQPIDIHHIYISRISRVA